MAIPATMPPDVFGYIRTRSFKRRLSSPFSSGRLYNVSGGIVCIRAWIMMRHGHGDGFAFKQCLSRRHCRFGPCGFKSLTHI